jgi:hypothetical protein
LESSPFGLKEVKVTHCVFQRKKISIKLEHKAIFLIR